MKPTNLALWATDINYPATSDPIKVEPSTGVKEAGWAPQQKPPAQWWNWWMNAVYLWVVWLNEFEDTAHTWTKTQTFEADDAVGPALWAVSSENQRGFFGQALSGSAVVPFMDLQRDISASDNPLIQLSVDDGGPLESNTSFLQRVYGRIFSSVGPTATLLGVISGLSDDEGFSGVEGRNTHAGDGYGVVGKAFGTGAGVYGLNDTGAGVYGVSAGGNGGVFEGANGGVHASGQSGSGAYGLRADGGSADGDGIVSYGGGTEGQGGFFSGGGGPNGHGINVATGGLKLSSANVASSDSIVNKAWPNTLLKARGQVRTDGAGGVVLDNGVNVTSVAISSGYVVITFSGVMANNSYSVVFGHEYDSPQAIKFRVRETGKTTAQCVIAASNTTDNSAFPFDTTNTKFHFAIFGDQ